ncbi:hypothetical protein FITA111629_09960 [Filibacter tadaridae]|uniref:YfzA-like protein n=1 Tax=Filibacter tadaridae TaxID=2483811 RepID=A0A3P5XBG6_9BACL|nr:hypothetical protein [Filibacter tadaridae]VDC32112.1 hypothetical protein FILTAD_02593 [Filibacter tadaridae]
MKKNNKRNFILILSIVFVFLFTFIPSFGLRVDEGSRFWGFPAEWLGIYEYGGFSFKLLGFLFNIAFFYLIFLLLTKIFVGLNNLRNSKTDRV